MLTAAWSEPRVGNQVAAAPRRVVLLKSFQVEIGETVTDAKGRTFRLEKLEKMEKMSDDARGVLQRLPEHLSESTADVGDYVNIPLVPRILGNRFGNICLRRIS
jgi:hypothetical protein